MKNGIFVFILFISGLLLSHPALLIAQSRAECLACHSDQSLTKEKEGKQVSIFVDEPVLDKSPHKKLVCVACHTGFNPENIPHRESIQPVNCLTCHKDVAFRHVFHPQLAAALVAGQEPDVSCKDCHGTHDIVSPKLTDSKFHESKLAESCGECHGDVKEKFVASSHGKALANAVAGAPHCLTCHRQSLTGLDATQDTLSYKIAQEKLCLSCHLDNPDVRSRTSPSAGFIASYEKSVHGSALLDGNRRAANCVDCHGSHEMTKGSDPASSVNRAAIPQTCGKCHADIMNEFRESVHGVALAAGVTDAPVCTNCHGEHTIYGHNDPRSSVATNNIATQCIACHGSVKLTEKFGVAGNRSQTFADSYHGLALKGGAVNVANCASCHGSHNIRRSSDPASSVNKGNLAMTCGKCHPGANKQFAVGSVHVAMTAAEDPLLYWIATAYIILIIATIGGMFVHNLLDFIRKSKRKLMIRRGIIIEEHPGHSLYLRMTLNERLQHGALLVSFLLLAITGFMLRYPDAWWVAAIRTTSSQAFELRSLVHRIAAVVMVAASAYHISYISFTRRGRELLRDILPKIQDLGDAIAVMKYNLGISKIKPRLGRFSYVEKSEYWALVWGTIVM
ncbi:MAG TPA: cytochrome B, partial [Bacteroidota bacterium]|nr:cytochrome B [Bacteroidota bacterium]